jgi:hypothetical protein
MLWNFSNVGVQTNTEIRSLPENLFNELLTGHATKIKNRDLHDEKDLRKPGKPI